MDNFCNFVNVFYGNGEVDHFAEEGLASKWFYIKALAGNTLPHAALPFGKMSVGAYSGGYPGGYGTHYPNCCGGIEKLWETNKAMGFSHIHHSGVGGISYYFNYAVTTPFYGELGSIGFLDLENEEARPGYYSCEWNNVKTELTVSKTAALHRYSFLKQGGRLRIDFSNDGLNKKFGPSCWSFVKDGKLELNGNEILFEGVFSGIKLYFAVRLKGENIKLSTFEGQLEVEKLTNIKDGVPYGALVDFAGDKLEMQLAYSTISFKEAENELENANCDFDGAVAEAYELWNEKLSVIEIETEDAELKERFYSNLYHSLMKPTDMSGENVLGVKGTVVTGIATFWDQYKTLYPLIFTLYPEMAKKIASGIVGISEALGKIPCSFDLTTMLPCEEQARMLGIYSLCDAYYYGVEGITSEKLDECVVRELEREDFAELLTTGFTERYTHITDTTDACLCAAEITNNNELKKKLLKCSESWSNAYDGDGLMSQNSPYYEGDRYTYSFRLLKNMEQRIELAGGKEKFTQMLDSFFGFGKESLKQLTHLNAEKEINAAQHHRFEGFNNECDMETPYAYMYVGRPDRLSEIIHAGITQSFLSGRGGLPGNNDSGGLSSCYVWNVLGLFPIAGQGRLFIGSPHIEKATLKLSSGKKLTISVKRKTKESFKTVKAVFNGENIENLCLEAGQVLNGGDLVIYTE